MAKTKSKDTRKVKDSDFKSWSENHSIRKKEDFKTMMEIRNKYEEARSGLRTSCFWDAYQEDSTGSTFSGGDWYERWNLQEKMALMWYRKPDVEDFMSNIKSPMTRGRVNTFVNWMKKINIEFGARPNNRDDRNASLMADKTTNYWMQNSNAKAVLGDAWEDLAIHGNTYLRLSYVKENKEFRFPKTKDLSEEELKELQDGKRKLVYSKPEKTTILDDVVLEHVPIRELYPDPQARNLHGDTYRAGWVVRKRYVTLEYVKAVYGDHPSAEYVDKVKGSVAYRDYTDYFFEPPKNYWGDDIVELLEYEDQDNDRYVVIANDIPIVDSPLPYNHKEISYHKLDFIRVPGQFFSIGIADLLDNIQASYEVALNMVADYIYRTYNYKLLVESDNFGEIKQSLQRTGDMFIPIDASDGRAINSKVMPLQPASIGFDIFSFLELLEQNATLATNIDPAQMAMLAGSKTATSDILNKELLMTMIGGIVDNNTNGDLKSIGRQLWKLQQQHYTKPRVQKIEGKDKPVKVNRTLRFEGIEIKLNDETGLLEEKENEGDYSFFELTDEFLSTKDEIDIFIKPESQEVQSQALEEKRMAEEFAQLMPFAVDPNNPMQVQSHQMPMIDANKLFKEYFNTKRLPEDLLINRSVDKSLAVKQAEEHIMSILKGDNVQAVPGQSSAHLEYEYQVLDALMFELEELDKEIMEDLEKQQAEIEEQMAGVPQFDPYTGQPMEMPQPIPPQDKVEKAQKLAKTITKIEEHISIESMPAVMRNSRIAVMRGAAEEAPPEMGGMETPMPQDTGANTIDPSMINPNDPAGQVPMGAPVAEAGSSLPQQAAF